MPKAHHHTTRGWAVLAKAKAFRAFADGQEQPLLEFLFALVLGQVQLVKTVTHTTSISVTSLHKQQQQQKNAPAMRRRQRVRVANLMASNGSEWVAHFKRHNSGTYNNQYMVTDLTK